MIKIQKLNFGDTPEGDITKINEKTIPNHDILCAGFPCQSFSISGKQKGFNDSRGTLFFDVARIVKEKKPKVIFMENVKNFATHDNGNTLNVVKKTTTDLGYDFYWNVLNSIDYGIPQKRERIYMVCFRKDLILNSTDIMQNTNKTIRIGTVGKGGQGERIYSPKGIAITLSSNGGAYSLKLEDI